MEAVLFDVKEALESGDPKKAFKKCVAVLATEENPLLLAYKALSLLRLNRRTEAYRAASEAQARLPSDFSSLEVLVSVFQDLHKYSHVADLYEKFFESHPTQDVGQRLFEAYAADFRFVEQQSLSMKLFKRFELQDYAVRTAECLYLTAKSDPRQGRMAEIAQLLLNKLTRNEDFQCTEAFLRVYLLILTEIRQFTEAITLVERYSSLLPNFIERATILADLARKNGDVIAALNHYHEVLKLNLNETTARALWGIYMAYIETLFGLVTEAMQGTTPCNPDSTLDPSAFLVRGLDTSNKGNAFKPFSGGESIISLLTVALGNIKGAKEAIEGASKPVKTARREAFLAELEFKRRLVYAGFPQGPEEYKSDNEPGNVFFHLVFRYATTQYEHESTADDLIPYIKMLNISQLPPLRAKMMDYFHQINELSTNKQRVLRCYVTGMKVLRLLGCFSPPFIKHHGLLWDTAKLLHRKYEEALNVEPVPTQGEVRVADELMLLACEILLQPQVSPGMDPLEAKKCDFAQFQFETETGFALSHRLLHSIALLEFALRNSPFNTKLKLGLVDLYARAGALETAHRLYFSLDFLHSDFDKTAHLVFGPMHDFYPLLNELEPLTKRVLKYHESFRESRISAINEAYERHSLAEILELRTSCVKQDRSLFAFVAKVSLLELEVSRKLGQPNSEIAHMFRDSADLIAHMCSLKGGSEDFESVADESFLFYVGVVPVQSMIYKSSRAKYDNSDFRMPARSFVRKERVVSQYGWKSEYRSLSLKGTLLKLYFDSIEGNSEVLDTDLREFVNLLDDMGLLTSPAEKLAKLEKQSEVILSTKEAARKAKEELKSGEGFYSGVFDSEEAFKSHRKQVTGLLTKFHLMMFEGLWRLLKGHSSFRGEGDTRTKNTSLVDLDPTLKLTEWHHVSRHFEVLEMMFREIVASIIPREDLFQFMKLKSGEVFDRSAIVATHPGMTQVIAECISGPFVSLMMLQPLYNQALTAASSRLMDNPDPTEVEGMRSQVRKLYNEVFRQLDFLQKYLEMQVGMCFLDERTREIQGVSAFQGYSLFGGLDAALYNKIVENFKQANEWSVRVLAEGLKNLLHLPRL